MSGVSTGTVDRILHNRGKVSEEAQKKVEKVLKEIDYHPNLIARSLALKKNYHFITLIPSFAKGEYWDKLCEGIDKAEQELFSYNVEVERMCFNQYDKSSFDELIPRIEKADCQGVVIATQFHDSVVKLASRLDHERMCFNQYDKSSFDELIPRIEKADCQGVVIATQFHDSVVKLASRLDQLQIPYILIDAFIENTNCVAYYGTNSYDSGYIAGRLLYEQINPTENIAIFRFIRKGEMQVTQVMKREEGFRTYLAEKNYNGRIYSVQLHADEPEKNISILNTFLEEHKEVNAGIIFNSRAHLLGKYFRDKGENFRLIGYDVIDPNITCLNDGSITHLIAQRPEVQGFNCIRALFRHLVLKEKVEQINYMPIDILMKENIKYYNNYI